MSSTPSFAVAGITKRSRGACFEIALLAILVSALTLFAVRAFPLWDDGQTLLEARRGGGQAVFDSMPDRPVLGKIMSLMVDSGHLVAVSAVVFWLTWFGAGWVTMRLWKILFPSRPEFALPAACLAVAPVIYQLQTVLINPTLAAMAGPVLTWLVILKLLEPVASEPSALRTLTLRAVMIVAVAASAMISEYVLPTVSAGVVLLAFLAPRPAGNAKQAWITIGLLLLTAAAGYAVYHHLGNAEFRSGVRPESQNWSWRIPVVAPRLLTAIWKLSLGMLLERTGLMDFSADKEMVVALFAGLALAGSFQWMSRRRADNSSIDDESRLHNPRVLLALGLAVVAGIFPVIVMGQSIRTWTGTRLFGPVLPVASCWSVAVLSLFLRGRSWKMLPAICGLLAGYYIIGDGLLAARERKNVVLLGDRLEAFVPDNGLTVAFVNRDWLYPPHRVPGDPDITARLTLNWTPEKREHFWAFAGSWIFEHSNAQIWDNKRTTILLDTFGPNPRLWHLWRDDSGSASKASAAAPNAKPHASDSRSAAAGVESVSRFLWVSEDSSGELHVTMMQIPKGPSP